MRAGKCWIGIVAAVTGLTCSPGLARPEPQAAAAAPADGDVGNWVVPALQSWRATPGQLTLRPGLRIVVAKNDPAVQAVAKSFATDLTRLSGMVAPVVTGSGRAGDIVLTIDPKQAAAGSQSPERYDLAVTDRVVLTGGARSGLLYATQTLLQLLKHDRSRRSLPMGVAQDWPNYRQRAVMVDAGRRYYEVDTLEQLMREMAWLKLNTLSLHFTDWPAFRLNSPKFPGLADAKSYDRADIQRLEATAETYGITIIPEIDMPAHAAAAIRYRPSLAFRCPSMRQSGWLTKAAGSKAADLAWTIDITREENRQWIRSVLAEFMPWFRGPYFHIGGDEYQYDADKTRCPELMAYAKQRGFAYPGDVFVDWINETNRFVREHGKQTALWSWWRFGDDRTSIQPDRNILIYSWNAPRMSAIVADGYPVMATPEGRLYVSPGLEREGGGYGFFDVDAVYAKMNFERAPNIGGYMVALWADAAEPRSDGFFMGRLYEPMRVMSERLWSDRKSPTGDTFFARVNAVGNAPR